MLCYDQLAAGLSNLLTEKIDEGAYPGIIFVRTKAEGLALAEELQRSLGVPVHAVSADMPEQQRKALAAKMVARDEAAMIAVATSVWSTGINIPSVQWVIRTSNGTACIPLEQEAGRGARIDPSGGKTDFMIYDVVDVTRPTGLERAAKRAQEWIKRGYTVQQNKTVLNFKNMSEKERDIQLTTTLFDEDAAIDRSSELKSTFLDTVKHSDQELLDLIEDNPAEFWRQDPIYQFFKSTIILLTVIHAVLCLINAVCR